jgi:hypothetical protein
MDITTDGQLLLAANNAEDPPFATLFSANGNAAVSKTFAIIKITVDPTIIPKGAGLSLEQPAWDPTTQRFYTSIPTIANNPPGCVLGGTPACSGGLLVTDPDNPVAVEGAFAAGHGVIPLPSCGPNGATVGVHDNLLLGCTPGNFPPGTTTLVINAKTHNTAHVDGITGSDEVWFNKGDNRYYLGASKAIKPAGSTLGSGAVLGVVDGTSVLRLAFSRGRLLAQPDLRSAKLDQTGRHASCRRRQHHRGRDRDRRRAALRQPGWLYCRLPT